MMTKAEFQKKLAKSKYFCDGEGTLKIVDLYSDYFLVEDADGELYELHYSDYTDGRQKFQLVA